MDSTDIVAKFQKMIADESSRDGEMNKLSTAVEQLEVQDNICRVGFIGQQLIEVEADREKIFEALDVGIDADYEIFFAGSIENQLEPPCAPLKPIYVLMPTALRLYKIRGIKWHIGDYCWAMYSDGFYYPAIVKQIFEDDDGERYEVEFVYYDGSGTYAADELLLHEGESFIYFEFSTADCFVNMICIDTAHVEIWNIIETRAIDNQYSVAFLRPYDIASKTLIREMDKWLDQGLPVWPDLPGDPTSTTETKGKHSREAEYHHPIEWIEKPYCIICKDTKFMSTVDPRFHTTGSCNKLGRCIHCMKCDHHSDYCPKRSDKIYCFQCSESGHRFSECKAQPFCYKCYGRGHKRDRCPFFAYSSSRAQQLSDKDSFIPPHNFSAKDRELEKNVKETGKRNYMEMLSRKEHEKQGRD